MEEAKRKLGRVMDVDAASGITDSAIDIDPYNIQHSTDVDMVLFFAARTKPLNNNKFKKRVGAKMTKKLELAENAEHVLNQADATTYRALAAQCNYLSQDRPDISYSSKELCCLLFNPIGKQFQEINKVKKVGKLPLWHAQVGVQVLFPKHAGGDRHLR